MLMSKGEHRRIVAAKDAEIAGLMKRLEISKTLMSQADVRIRELKDRGVDLWQKAHDAEARLAVFTAPRQRDSRGRYQPISRKGEAA